MHVASSVAPAHREALRDRIAAHLPRWEARVIEAEHDPVFWPLGTVLGANTELGVEAGLPGRGPHDLRFVEGIALQQASRADLEDLARRGDPRRWTTAFLDVGSHDDGTLELLSELPLHALRALHLCGKACTKSRLARTLQRLDAPLLRDLTLNAVRAQDFTVLASIADRVRVLRILFTKVDARAAEGLGALSPHLEELEVIFCKLSAETLEALLAPSWPSLRRLDLVGNPLGERGARALVQADARLPTLEHLEVGNTKLGSKGTLALARSALFARLRTLGVGGSPEGGRMTQRVAVTLLERGTANGPMLNDGQLEQYMETVALGSSPRDIETIARSPGLLHVRVLTAPQLRSREAAARLAESPYLSGLETLRLPHCGLDAEALGAILRNPTLRGLAHLELHGPYGSPTAHARNERHVPLSLDTWRALATSGLRPKTLELEGSGLDDEGAAILAEAGVLDAIEVLEVPFSRLSSAGLANLIAAAPKLHTLQTDGNRLGPEAGRVIGRSGRRFEHLGLAGAQLGDRGLHDLLSAGLPLDALASLNLAANRLGDASAERLAEVLRAPIMLDVSANTFTMRGLEVLRALGERPLWDFYGGIRVDQNRGRVRAQTPTPCWIEVPSMVGQTFALAGSFALGDHRALARRIEELGGTVVREPEGASVVAVGHRPGPRLARAVAHGSALLDETGLSHALGTSLEAVLDARLEEARLRLPDPDGWRELTRALDRWPDASVADRVDRLVRDLGERAEPTGPIASDHPTRVRWSNVHRAPRRWLRRSLRRDEPRLQACNTLDLGKSFDAAATARFLAQMESVRVVDLALAPIDARVVRALDARALRGLRLFASLDEPTRAALAESRFGETLHALAWEAPPVPELFASLRSARVLRFACELRANDVAAIVAGPRDALEELSLSRVRVLDRASARALAHAPLPSLRRLALAFGSTDERALAELSRAAWLGALTSLALYGTADLTPAIVQTWIARGLAKPGTRIVLHGPSTRRVTRELALLREAGAECIVG